jgi:hypothetical protein
MDTPALKALEIEALTYIWEPDPSASASERARWWQESVRGYVCIAAVQVAFGLLAGLAWALMPVVG